MDMFKPYSPELRGELEVYLKDCEEGGADNLFCGPEHFFEIKDKGFIVPGVTYIRADQSPAPDIGYFVNSEYMLESRGLGHRNMSLMGAEEGVYDPNEALKDQLWSISWLNLLGESFPLE